MFFLVFSLRLQKIFIASEIKGMVGYGDKLVLCEQTVNGYSFLKPNVRNYSFFPGIKYIWINSRGFFWRNKR